MSEKYHPTPWSIRVFESSHLSSARTIVGVFFCLHIRQSSVHPLTVSPRVRVPRLQRRQRHPVVSHVTEQKKTQPASSDAFMIAQSLFQFYNVWQ